MPPIQKLPSPLRQDVRNKWEALLESSTAAGIALPEDPGFLNALVDVFAFSDFVADSCIRHPKMLADLLNSGNLAQSYPPAAYTESLSRQLRNCTSAAKLDQLLRRQRRREMVRIAWRDLAGWADLAQTMSDLSYFADACITQAIAFHSRQLYAEYGRPVDENGQLQPLVVIAMGKLGGMELNFSSDIDLVFAFPESGTTQGNQPIANEAFFTRLCRRLVNTLGAASADGMMFRVDLRLRPDGENGPLVMDFDNMEEYYQRQGREWERYAWIKARIAAGDPSAGEQLIERLKPFVFRRYLDYSAFDALRDMKAKITLEVKQRRITDDIKLGSGGIREIEFFGQSFQLIRGGVTPELQQRPILSVLAGLFDKKYISRQTRDDLSSAYRFLRVTENRLQQSADQQTHRLPSDDLGRLRLAVSTGFGSWEAFSQALQRHQEAVRVHFHGLLTGPEDPSTDRQQQDQLTSLWLGLAKTEQDRSILTSLGFDDADAAIDLLQHLQSDPATRSLSAEGRKRLDRLVPQVLLASSTAKQPVSILNRILNLIRTIQQRTNYLSLLLENPTALSHLASLAEASPWLISFLSRHPVLLDELLDPRALYAPPGKAELQSEIAGSLRQIPEDDLEYQIEQLCIFKQVNTLRIAAADVSGALPLMRTSDHLTELAETVIDQVLDLSWQHLAKRHGTPAIACATRRADRGFAVIAYGKLGGIELGYASDLDLVFLHAGAPGQTQGGSRPIDNAHFFSRLGQRVIHTLTAYTRAGKLYETDVRLRPSGDSGVLVSHIDAFKSYQTEDAWTWEHQALIRARAISGDTQMAADFTALRHTVLAQPRNAARLCKDVCEMRQRMRREAPATEPNAFDLKEGTGGIVDIEFIVQFLVLLKSHEHPSLTRWTDNVRLIESLNETGTLDGETAQILKIAYLAYRSAAHRLSLQEKPPILPIDHFAADREKIIRIWNDVIGIQTQQD